MYQKKTPKSQCPEKNEFTVYNPHTVDPSLRHWGDVVKVISIDPGIRNLALRVESRGIRTDEHPIKTIVFEKLRITDEERKLVGNVDQLFFLITNFLDKYREIFLTCDMLLIERQLPINYKAVRISQHIITYFLILFKNLTPSLPLIYEVDPKLKGRELGADSHLNERGIKFWAVTEAKSLLTKRKDYEGLAILQKNKAKSDDLADTICMCESFFSFNGWPLTREYTETKQKPKPKLVLKTEPLKPQAKPKAKLTLKTVPAKPNITLKIVS